MPIKKSKYVVSWGVFLSIHNKHNCTLVPNKRKTIIISSNYSVKNIPLVAKNIRAENISSSSLFGNIQNLDLHK